MVGEELSSLLSGAEVSGLLKGEGGTGGLNRVRQGKYYYCMMNLNYLKNIIKINFIHYLKFLFHS